MQDIGKLLEDTAKKNNCTVFDAFLFLMQKETDNVYLLQSKSESEPRWGLRDSSNKYSNESRLG